MTIKKAVCAAAVLPAVIGLLLWGCQQPPQIRSTQHSVEGLDFELSVSPSREKPNKLDGKLRIVNNSADPLRYSNSALMLGCGAQQMKTRLESRNSGNLVDTGFITMMPGEAEEFFVFWEFPSAVDFVRDDLKLAYTAALGLTPGEEPYSVLER